MRRLVVAVVALVAIMTLTACTPAQVRAWVSWHAIDPDSALAYLETPEGRATLDDEAETADVTAGDCESYWPLMRSYGLPRVFVSIAWRESGCNHRSYVHNRTDIGGGLLGLNLRAGAAAWRSWCGLTTANVTDAETNVACAAAAYQRLGMRPWST